MARGPEQRRSIVKLTSPDGEAFTMTTELRPAGSYGESFVVVFQNAAKSLAFDNEAPPQAARLYLWAVSGGLSFETYRTISQAEVGCALFLSQATVGRCLAYLRDNLLVERIGAGPRQQWRLTPTGAWRGTTGQYHRRRRADAASQGRLSVIEGGRDGDES